MSELKFGDRVIVEGLVGMVMGPRFKAVFPDGGSTWLDVKGYHPDPELTPCPERCVKPQGHEGAHGWYKAEPAPKPGDTRATGGSSEDNEVYRACGGWVKMVRTGLKRRKPPTSPRAIALASMEAILTQTAEEAHGMAASACLLRKLPFWRVVAIRKGERRKA